jgi:hypothetical protein
LHFLDECEDICYFVCGEVREALDWSEGDHERVTGENWLDVDQGIT